MMQAWPKLERIWTLHGILPFVHFPRERVRCRYALPMFFYFSPPLPAAAMRRQAFLRSTAPFRPVPWFDSMDG